ncbi:hemerythrin domain-containing protein [Longispora fulva]|uniref:Hemerythrin-like domain-containing protein n=1 Tax=Longispora fulva TaxID=619741 RepID=A0A8J7GWW4_9ACTN|nr:hemerythrin domain-containing protein [Longispora fulva]MBG6140429.1 hypothetical protein [Longispora fulva]
MLETAQALEGAVVGRAPVEQLHQILSHLRVTLAAHPDSSETGPYAEILTAAPHLTRRVRVLVGEHDRLALAIDGLFERLEAGPGRRFAKEVAELLRLLRAHQRRGAQLLHEAYTVDLGGET